MMDEEQFLGYSDCFVFISCFSDMIRRGGGGRVSLSWLLHGRSVVLPFYLFGLYQPPPPNSSLHYYTLPTIAICYLLLPNDWKIVLYVTIITIIVTLFFSLVFNVIEDEVTPQSVLNDLKIMRKERITPNKTVFC